MAATGQDIWVATAPSAGREGSTTAGPTFQTHDDATGCPEELDAAGNDERQPFTVSLVATSISEHNPVNSDAEALEPSQVAIPDAFESHKMLQHSRAPADAEMPSSASKHPNTELYPTIHVALSTPRLPTTTTILENYAEDLPSAALTTSTGLATSISVDEETSHQLPQECQARPQPPLPECQLLPDIGETVAVQTLPELCDSDTTTGSPVSSPLSEFDVDIAGQPVEYDHDGPPNHKVLRLKPTPAQWEDFPAILSFARQLGAESDGCFKVQLPEVLNDPLPEKAAKHVPANAYKVKQIKHRTFWQVSTVQSEGVFSSSETGPDCSVSAEAAIKNLKALFNKNKDRQMRNVRYRVDVPAWTAKQRLEAGVPERSPIYPLKGDKLDSTKAIIPGIHTPYVYESGPYFGATFQIHAEDFRLASLNHLYKGRKIWIVVPSTAVDVAEMALERKGKCSQFMRHRAEFFFPERLEKMGIPFRIVDQRPGETIVILPDAYHEGFSTGYTIAEAKNYADPNWTTETYQPCQMSCQLMTAIPAEFMRPLQEGEARLDLCAGYGDGVVAIQPPLLVPAAVPLPEPQHQNEEGDQKMKEGEGQRQEEQQPTESMPQATTPQKRSHEDAGNELMEQRMIKHVKV